MASGAFFLVFFGILLTISEVVGHKTTTTVAAPTCPTPDPCPTITCPTCATCPPIKKCVPSCEQGWTYFAATDSCYRVYHKNQFYAAEADCVLKGAHLTSIHSLLENTFVNTLAATGIKEENTDNLAWIGMHQMGRDWVWTDGTPSDYFNWAPKQPDSPGRELCVQTAPDSSYGDRWYWNWNNNVCDRNMRAYVCKKASIHV